MKRKWRKRILALLALPFAVVLLSNLIIEWGTSGKLYDDVTAVPYNKVGIVLGTARHRTEGGINPYYQNRIDATVDLFNAGKISFVLVSGDNGSIYYNEPDTIKKDLIEAGIPQERIFLDYAGFRTLDSMMRAKTVFGLDSATIISQEFHNERAIFIAGFKGLDAIGYNAEDLSGRQGLKVQTREVFARVKVFVDLLLNTQPKYLGEGVRIE
ncbi:SanA protein [Robiginitalea myxolifaciens]|uniref:SanA protein n=1 Tax=Robiginitalea myxolifaciens TaxID=400055 RepID=A0A1I6FSU2_9FLAO|nr:ElyC/SanA/YdcF family protein [Robiginitalea myxolifaciens]SFR32976.1 SanA protein [Robiginitalea myxolifaciens]